MNARRVISGIGRTLIALGVLVLLFVAYQLWGTGIAESRSQHHLRGQINRILRSTTTTVTPTAAPPTTTTSPAEAPPPDNRLTLTTCEPRFSAAKRLIVVAHLVGTASPPPPTPTTTPAAGTAPKARLAGLSGGHASKTPAILWGLGAALVWFLAWLW